MVASVAVIAPAMAQDTSVETVVVTGSRIPQTGLYSSSPVAVVGSQAFKDQGTTNTEQLLRTLPGVTVDGDNSASNNGTGGEATIDLRGLGANRTLVLIDGTRMQPADTTGEVDLNEIPSQMIDHIEILTGGASSTYGGDAVSGVINLVLRKDFEGVEASGFYSETNHNDGPTDDESLVIGANSADGKGNVTVYAEYMNRDPISDGARETSKYVAASPDGPFAGACLATFAGGFCQGGSLGYPAGHLTNTLIGDQTFTQAGGFVPTTGAVTNNLATTQYFDFAPSEFLQTSDQRYSLGAEGHYEVNKELEFYTRIMFADNDSHSQLAPIPFNDNVDINCGNPYMTNAQRAVLFPLDAGGTTAGCAAYGGIQGTETYKYRARLLAAGPRNSEYEHSSYQALVGAKGDLGDGLSYDFSASYGQTTTVENYGGDASSDLFKDTLLSDALGTCENGDPACVPSDIFHTQLAIAPGVHNYISQADIISEYIKQWDIQGTVVGNLGEEGITSPWAKNGVGFAVGGEYRQDSGSFTSAGPISVLDGSAGYGTYFPSHGSYNVSEVYGEVQIPILENLPFAESLEADGGYRYSSYNLSGAASTWKAALSWQPVDDIKFRGSIDRAVREPHISDLFGGAQQSADPGYDPCGEEAIGQAVVGTAAMCDAVGGGVHGQYLTQNTDCGGQCTSFHLSNPNLRPEVGHTKSLGVVLTPTFLDGFTLTADYYWITIDQAIAITPLQTVLNACYSQTNPNYAPCLLVHRDTSGTISSGTGYVDLPSANINSQKVDGFDFESHYRTDADTFGMPSYYGSVGFDFRGNLAMSNNFTDYTGVTKCAGAYNPSYCAVPAPRWQHTLRLNWYSADSNVSASLAWRYFTGTKWAGTASDVANAAADPYDATLPSESYFDLSADWDITKSVSIYGGVNNILDKKPPIIDDQLFVPSTENANSFPQLYDGLGAVYYVGGSVKF